MSFRRRDGLVAFSRRISDEAVAATKNALDDTINVNGSKTVKFVNKR